MAKSKKVRALTSDQLRRIVLEEKRKHETDVSKVAEKTREVEADEYADTLENEVDYLALLKIKEARLVESLRKVRAEEAVVRERITKRRA